MAPLTGPATQAQAALRELPTGADWHNYNGVIYHTPHLMPTRTMVAQGHGNPNTSNAQYFGGPLLTSPKIYLIFWGYKKYGDPDKVKPLLTDFAKNVGKTRHNDVYDQYYQDLSSVTTFVTDPKGQLAGVWDDETNPVPASPSQGQVASEAGQGVNHFGFDPNGSYVVATPHGHNTSGFGVSFCAYHDAAYSGSSIFSFTNLPYMPDSNPQYACGAGVIKAPHDEQSVDLGVTVVEGHEYGESITDPIPGEGWYNFSWGEIGDICAWTDIKNDPFHKKRYTSQPMWSNATNSCVHKP